MEIACAHEGPTGGPYNVILADPPWYYGRDMVCNKNGALPYKACQTGEICYKHRPPVADNAVLFLWTTGGKFPDALSVMTAWGFKFVTVVFVWVKSHTVTGTYTLPSCEFILLGTRGSPKPLCKLWTNNVRQVVHTDRTEEGRHSFKPLVFYDKIESLLHSPAACTKLEMYARASRPGWDCWGNEAPDGRGAAAEDGTCDDSVQRDIVMGDNSE
jgi:N6-adenosine-specific RNA methylase IME4